MSEIKTTHAIFEKPVTFLKKQKCLNSERHQLLLFNWNVIWVQLNLFRKPVGHSVNDILNFYGEQKIQAKTIKFRIAVSEQWKQWAIL